MDVQTLTARNAFSNDTRVLARYDAALVRSFERTGFAVLDIAGLRLPQQRFAALFDWMEPLFAQSLEAKRPFMDPASSGERGFTLGGEIAIGRTAADVKQFFMFGEPRDPQDPATSEYPANVYPQGVVPGVDVERLVQGVRYAHAHLARYALHRPIARQFGYDAATHEAKLLRADSPLRLLYYPADPSLEIGQEVGGAHTDIDAVTLLPSTERHTLRGLELKIGDEWLPVPVKPGQVVVNLGDLYQWMLEDQLPSTRHRVVCVDPTQSRMSAPYFSHFRKNTVIGASPVFPNEFLTEERALDCRLAAIGLMPETVFLGKYGDRYAEELAFDRTRIVE